MELQALILGNIAPPSGCDFKNSKALEMIDISEFALFTTRNKTLNILSARSGPKLCAKLVCHSLFGEGVPPRPHPGSGTANSISRRQRDRVMVHGHV